MKKKLRLNKESIRLLTSKQLEQAGGGFNATSVTCSQSCRTCTCPTWCGASCWCLSPPTECAGRLG